MQKILNQQTLRERKKKADCTITAGYSPWCVIVFFFKTAYLLFLRLQMQSDAC